MKTNKNISAIATMKKKQLIDKEGASLIRALIIDYRTPCHVYQ